MRGKCQFTSSSPVTSSLADPADTPLPSPQSLLCKLSFGPTPLCCAACSPHAPMLAVGSADGVLRMVLLSRVGDMHSAAMATVIHR
jgi:hypothetical protein